VPSHLKQKSSFRNFGNNLNFVHTPYKSFGAFLCSMGEWDMWDKMKQKIVWGKVKHTGYA
jgi:hypothetical protein